MDKLIGTRLGQYRLVEQVGQGGMATVFKAYQPALDRYVAVKVLPAQHALTPGFPERFDREAKAVAQLNHPNILPIYDFGQEDDLSYIVTKYVPAGTLKERLGQPLELPQAIRYVEQLGGALDHAHQRGILHRDVKPSNVLVDDGDWTLLTDFGLARMIAGESQLTGSGVGIGTPAYMPPEQIMGETVDHRGDVYALGVVLYEMVTGRVPYEAETPMAVALKHVQGELPLPRSVNPDLPESVERVILKALSRAPGERYAAAGDLAQALQRGLQETTTLAAPAQTPAPPPPQEPTPAPTSAAQETQAAAQKSGPPQEALGPKDLLDLLNVPIPGLPLTVASGLLIALLALLGLALVRYLVGGWVVFLFFVAAILAVPYWLRPRQVGPEVRVVQRPFNGLDRSQPWQARDEEIWFFAGDFKLDLGQAELPPGETYVGLFGFAGDIEVKAPPDLGLSLSVAAFVHDANILGERYEEVMTPIQVDSDNYGSAERKVRLKIRWFAGDLEVRRA